MFISKPKVKDLLAFLAGCDAETPGTLWEPAVQLDTGT